MAVAYDAQSESHTGTSGSTSQASFSWSHVPTGTPRGAVVFVLTVGPAALADYSTSVTYGGTTMTKVPYYARDSDTELGAVAAYWLDNVASGTQTVVVNRTNNTAAMYAACYTVTAAGEIEVPHSLVKTRAGSGAEQTAASSDTGSTASAWSSISLDDGSPGTNSVRFMGVYSGAATVSTAGTGTTAGPSIDFGNYVFGTYYETTAGQGSRSIAISTAISDDLAVLGLAVREKPTPVISLGLLDASAALYAPTVAIAAAAQDISLGLLDGASALYAPTLAPKNTVTLAQLDAVAELYGPSLAVGPVGVTLGLLDASSALYAPTVAIAVAAQTLTLPRITPPR